MDGGLILTRNLLVMRAGEVVGHLSRLEVMRCEDGTEETEVVLHLLEPKSPGASMFHAWREAGEGLKPEKDENPRHVKGESDIEAICYEKTCIHSREQPEDEDGKACPVADLNGWLTLDDDSWNGQWHYFLADGSEVRCGSYERRDDADEDDEAYQTEEAKAAREFREAEEAGQLALPV